MSEPLLIQEEHIEAEWLVEELTRCLVTRKQVHGVSPLTMELYSREISALEKARKHIEKAKTIKIKDPGTW